MAMFQSKKWLRNSFWPICLFLIGHGAAFGQVRVNELLALNSSVINDPDFGEFSDYIELYNASNEPVNLNGFFITDNPGNTTKWRFPELVIGPQQCLVLWADGRGKAPGDTAFCTYRNAVVTVGSVHLGFALSGEGEYVGIYDPQGNKVDEQWFGVQQHDVSFGRDSDEPDVWKWFGDASPGEANSKYGAPKPVFASEPVFSLQGGFYPDRILLSIVSNEAGADIRYTIDGSNPVATSQRYEGPIEIFRNLTVKARVFVQGKMAGPIVANTYFIGETTKLPVISIASNSTNLWDFEFGLFRNSIKEREIPASIEYFEPSGERGFSGYIGLRIFGSTIYNLPQKPLSIRFRSRYGEPELVFPLFEGRENIRYRSFLLRNGGNDHNLSYFRDGLAVNLIKGKMNLDYQEYKPCIVFINGEYQGIYELRERLDADYVANNHNISSSNIDLIEDSLTVVAGDATEFGALLDFVRQNSLVSDENYNYIAAAIDLDEYINYMIHKIFIGYWLVDLNNKYWREKEEAGRWRWIASDMEHAFGQLSGDNFWENTF